MFKKKFVLLFVVVFISHSLLCHWNTGKQMGEQMKNEYKRQKGIKMPNNKKKGLIKYSWNALHCNGDRTLIFLFNTIKKTDFENFNFLW